MRAVFLSPPISADGGPWALRTHDPLLQQLVGTYGLVFVSADELLRAAISARSDVGIEADRAIEDEGVAPDALVLRLVLRRLAAPDCRTRGWALEGFPRSRAQADALLAAHPHLDALVVIDVPTATLASRAAGGRLDASGEARLLAHEAEVTSVAEAFHAFDRASGASLPRLVRLDGCLPADELYEAARSAVAARTWARWGGQMSADGATAYRWQSSARSAGSAAAAPRLLPSRGQQSQPRSQSQPAQPPPTVVLIHGLFVFGAHLAQLGEALAEAAAPSGARVLSYDRLGCGHSPPPPADATLDGATHVAQLRSLLIGLGLGSSQVVLVGHSLGAGIAALYAEQHGGEAGRPLAECAGPSARRHVAGVALLAPVGFLDFSISGAALRALRPLAPALVETIVRRALPALLAANYAGGARADGCVALRGARAIADDFNFGGFDADLGAVLAFPFAGLARTAHTLGGASGLPVLLYQGERDAVVPFAANFPRWRHALQRDNGAGACALSTEVAPKLGHCFLEEDAAACNAVIADWLLRAVLEPKAPPADGPGPGRARADGRSGVAPLGLAPVAVVRESGKRV
jgi:pimeloyl-ACP methyl ester carboxylesterase/adenylate kinase family enzyme